MTSPGTARPRLRLPVPSWVRALGIVLVAAEFVGWTTRVGALPPAVAQPLSMDAPWSVPRTLVAAVFLAASSAAAFGAQRLSGRRTWWTAIAVITVAIALVKANNTLHRRAVEAVDGYANPLRSLLVLGGLAVAVIVWLYWLSRSERRDRRRVLLWLGLYAFAAVGVSTLSAVAQTTFGYPSVLTATAVLIEESSEALSAVGVLFAVLVGVAPRLVLPRDWALSRPSDTDSPSADVWRPTRQARRAQ